MNNIEKAMKIAELKAEIEKDFNAEVIIRLYKISVLVKSVLGKSFGVDKVVGWEYHKETDNILRMAGYEWVRYWNTADNIIIEGKVLKFRSKDFSKDLKARSLIIPLNILSMSDRDIAKHIRKYVKNRKNHLLWYRQYKAKETIQENLLTIKKLRAENRMLENDVKVAQELLENY